MDNNQPVIKERQGLKPSLTLILICSYLFLVIERPWESISYCSGLPIERSTAIIMILVAIAQNKFRIIKSPMNKWVFGFLALHFVFAPFAYNTGYAIDQGIKFLKNIVLYILMLSIVDDEDTLKFLIRAYVFTMIIYVSHSLLEFSNGRCVYRMGITRMIGVDEALSGPNAFGASMVLSLPFVYALLRFELAKWLRRVYYSYIFSVIVCVVLTGSRTSFVAMILYFLTIVVKQKGKLLLLYACISIIACGILWNYMPEEKRIRIQTLWDEDAGPSNAHESASGRMVGWKASVKMFKQNPITGVGAGGKNFVGYRVNNIDNIPLQSHVLYGQVIAEFGVPGLILFIGLVLSIFIYSVSSMKKFALFRDEGNKTFCYALGGAVITCLLLLLFFGIGGHNFYRPMWLWLAAWVGCLYRLADKKI